MNTEISSYKQRRVEHGWRSRYDTCSGAYYYEGNVRTPHGIFSYIADTQHTRIDFICNSRLFMWHCGKYMTKEQISRQVGKLCRKYFEGV